jgi:serine-type D-Ala-D-Ala carboxypeptidase (penicillin-binding protein 5/6)
MRLLILIIIYSLSLETAAVDIIPKVPDIKAQAYILQDFHSRQILLEQNSKQQLEPASLTKLMTAYIVFTVLKSGRIKLDDAVKISEKAWQMPGSRMYLEHGSTVSVEELLKGMIIQSGNDASVALAEHIAGSEENFVQLMNQQAKQLGLQDTNYVNSTGLSGENQYTTAYDQALMAAVIIQHFPDYYRWYSQKEYTHNNITQNNRNLLLWRDSTVDGMKTGYTANAGYCLVASAQREGMRLIAVVLSSSDRRQRATDAQNMLNYGYRFFKTYKLYPERQAISTQRVWQGNSRSVDLGLLHPLYVTVPKGQYANLKATLQIDKQIIAPVTAGLDYGLLRIDLNDNLLLSRPLLALNSVERGNILQQLVDYVWLQFQ